MTDIKSKNNEVGDMYIVNLDKTTIYNIFTKAGNYRGGKIYSNNKTLIIVSGKIKLISNIGGNDIEEEYVVGETIKINAGVAHILYFIEDSEIIEYFPKNTKSEKFDKYYKLKK